MDFSPASRSGDPATEWFTPLRFGAILALLLLGTFPRVILGLDSFVYRDYGVLAYPVIHYAHESFWRGELPLWNPLSNCGAPFLAQWGTMSLYPFSILYLLFPLPWSLSWFCLGHLFLGGMGVYFLARRWTGDGLAASVAGTVFVFNGVTLSCLMWPNYMAALGWMPWALGSAERAWREGGRWIVGAALAGAIQMLAGVPEIAAFTWLIALGLWLGAWIQEGSSWKPMVGRLLAVVLLVAGLAAAQLLPFFDLLAHSQRDRAFATSKWALPGWGWANLLVPLFHCVKTYDGPFLQQGQAFFSSCYLGTGVVALGWLGASRARSWRARLLGAVVLFGLIAALGENGHLYSWLRNCFPLMGVGRYPVKFMVLAAFAGPLLTAFAIAWWNRQPISEWSRDARGFLTIGVVLLAAMGAILWFGFRYPFPYDQWPATWHNAIWRAVFLALTLGAIVLLPHLVRGTSRTGLELGILILLALDVTTHTPGFNPTIAAADFKPWQWQQRRDLPMPAFGEARVMISPQAEKKLLNNTETNLAHGFMAKRLALWSNLNLIEAVPKVNGSSTLQLREQKQVESLIYTNPTQFATGLVDFLAVSRITSPTSAIQWSSRSNYCAMVTGGQQPVFADAPATLEALVSPGFDPRKTVYLPLEAKGFLSATNQTEARILRTIFMAQRVEIEAETKAPSLVVLAQSFYHPWQATVNGLAVPVLRANHAFQAVEVPAGHCQIVLGYQDRNFRIGAIISLLSLLVCLVLWRRPKAEG